jgi:hypothetical protein
MRRTEYMGNEKRIKIVVIHLQGMSVLEEHKSSKFKSNIETGS